jgi:two-component system, sensor histidine kinase PdtaS
MRRYLLFIVICFIVQGNLHAQQPLKKTSSDYISQIKKSLPDTNRVNLLYQLGLLYLSRYDGNGALGQYTDSAERAFTMAIKLVDSLHTDHLWFHLKRWLGATFFFKGDIEAGEKVFMEVIDDCRKKGDREKEASTWKMMAQKRERIETGYDAIAGYLAKSMELFRAMGQKDKEARTLLDIADLHFGMTKYQQAEDEALESLQIYRQANFPWVFDNYYLLSVINRSKGDLDKALLYADLCVKNVDSVSNGTINAGFFYGELALVYDELGLAEESAAWYSKAVEGRRKRDEIPIYVIRTAGLLVHQLVKINKTQEALEIILGIQKQYPPRNAQESAAIAQYLGYCYHALGDNSKAEKYFEEMLRVMIVVPDADEFQSMAYQDIGNFYLDTKKYDKAILFLSKALDPPDIYLVSRQRDMHLSLYTADSSLGNYLAAINHLRKYKFLTDSLFSERKSHQIEELQIKYQTEKREKDIILLNSQNKAQDARMQRSALIRNFIIGGVLLLAGFLYYRYHLKSISNKKMQEQQVLIQQKNLSLTQLVTEKEWLVKEIHHRVKNNFHMVMGLLATQSRFLKNPEAIEAMRESRHRIQAMSLIHQRLYQSDNLSTISMPAYVHELVSYLRESFAIPGAVQFSFDIDPLELDLSHAIPLGLILNEAITNAIKYAFPAGKTGLIAISVKKEKEDHCVVTVKDNGNGFDVAAAASKQSMGMKLMKGLSEDMEATMSISGEQGTTIQIVFYYGPEKNDNA